MYILNIYSHMRIFESNPSVRHLIPLQSKQVSCFKLSLLF